MKTQTIFQRYIKTDNHLKIHIKVFTRHDLTYLLIGSAGPGNYVTIPFKAGDDVKHFTEVLYNALKTLQSQFLGSLIKSIAERKRRTP